MKLVDRFKNRLLNSKLINDSFWSIVGNLVGRGLGLVAGIYVARGLGRDLFGEYSAIKNTVLFMSVISNFGLGFTATKFVADYTKNAEFGHKLKWFIKYTNKITLFFSGIVAVFIFLFSKYFADNILEVPDLVDSVKLVSILIIFNSLTTSQIGIISGLRKFKELAQINIVTGVISFLSTVILVYYLNFLGAIYALIITQITNAIINYILVFQTTKKIKTETKPGFNILKEIVNYSTPVAFQDIIRSLSGFLMNILLIKLSGHSELGIYNAAIQWNSAILFIPGILRNVILSYFSYYNDDAYSHNRILNITILINIIVTSVLSLGVFLFGDFISNFYGKTFSGLSVILTISVFNTIFSSVNNVFEQAYLSKSLNWQMLLIRFCRELAILVLFVFLVNYHIFTGAFAIVLAILVVSVLSLSFTIYYYKTKNKNFIFKI